VQGRGGAGEGAEGLAAEEAVTLQVVAQRLQEAQHERGARRRGKLHVARAPVRPHSDNLPAVGLRLQEGVEQLGLVGAVHTGLHRVLQHLVDGAGPKVVRELQNQLTIQMRPTVAVLVHVHTHC